jgi:hypothetical protein
MNDYTVEITYKRGAQTLQSFHSITCSNEQFAKVQAKRELNRTGIFGTFNYKVYGGETSVDKEQQVF